MSQVIRYPTPKQIKRGQDLYAVYNGYRVAIKRLEQDRREAWRQYAACTKLLGPDATEYPPGTIVKHLIRDRYYEVVVGDPKYGNDVRNTLEAIKKDGGSAKIGRVWWAHPGEYLPVSPDAPIHAIRKAGRIRDRLAGEQKGK